MERLSSVAGDKFRAMGGQAFETYRRTNTQDILYLAGGGIAAHPLGAAAGVRAIQHAWQAAVEGLTLDAAAEKSEELRASIAKFSSRNLTKNEMTKQIGYYKHAPVVCILW